MNPPKQLLPHHSVGMGLHKSPPKLHADAVITKSPTHSVAVAASTLIYQKNCVDGNSGGKGGGGQTLLSYCSQDAFFGT
jgi:hypothetical protein